jgi:hypothetical protein
MKIALATLKTLLESNVLEIKFTRRNPKPGAPPTRRMFCTNSNTLLNSTEGRRVLGFTPTSQPLKFNPSAKNLIVAWDLFKLGYRMINADHCELIATIPADDDFWLYYYEHIGNMTAGEKLKFYDI